MCLSIAALVYTSSSIPVWWELKDYISKEKAKRNRLTDRQDRQTNWYPLSEGHTSAVMVPHMNEEPQAGRTPQTSQKKKGKPLHTPSHSWGEAFWWKQEESWPKRSHKRHWKGCSAERPDLKAVKVKGKTPWPLDQKLEGCVYSRKKHISCGEQVPTPAAGCAALAWTITRWAETPPCWTCGAAENHCGGITAYLGDGAK